MSSGSKQNVSGFGPRFVALAVLAAVAVVVLFAVLGGGSDSRDAASVTTEDAAAAPTASDAVAADASELMADEPSTDEASTDEVSADDASGDEASAEVEPTATTPPPTATPVPAGPRLSEAPPILGVEEELRNIDGWLQSDIDSLADLDGKVHIVQFWTYGCYNCKNTLPNLIHIDETYGGENFEIVGVHAPEFEFEKNPESILEAAEELGVTWPIALDTNKTNFRSWQEARRFWPRTYVIDQNGDIRFDRIGEGAYEKLEATVAWLLENGPAA